MIKDEKFLMKFYIFISSLAIRTVGYRNKLTSLNTQIFQHLKRLGVKEYKGKDINSNPNELAKEMQLQQITSLAHSFESAKHFFSNFEFYIGINDTGFPLIISDEVAFNVELCLNDICIPITPNLAIIMRAIGADPKYLFSKDMPSGNTINLSNASIFGYNSLQYNQASRYVFGDKKEIQRVQFLTKVLTNPGVKEILAKARINNK